jgi:hypothetical protein
MNASKWTRVLVVLGLMWSLASPVWADPKPTVIAVINRADWCSVCKAHGERAGKAIMAANSDGALQLVVNDLTSDATAKRSAVALKAAGVDLAMAPYTATGVLYLFDAATRRPLAQVTVANTDQEIKLAIDLARKAAAHPR